MMMTVLIFMCIIYAFFCLKNLPFPADPTFLSNTSKQKNP